jgi:hypothetical protein
MSWTLSRNANEEFLESLSDEEFKEWFEEEDKESKYFDVSLPYRPHQNK